MRTRSKVNSLFKIKFWKSRYEKLIEENIELKEQMLERGNPEELQIYKQENLALISKIKNHGVQLQNVLEENESLNTELKKLARQKTADANIENSRNLNQSYIQELEMTRTELNQSMDCFYRKE